MKVLVVENNRQMRRQLCDLLEKEGFDITEAEDGTEAMECYAAQKPDFICLDIMMPGLSGYDVCRVIRKNDKETPIVFISSKSQVADKIEGLETGADDYITKPFDIQEVIARIRAVARRCMANASPSVREEFFIMDDLTVRPAHLRAERGGAQIDLSLREIALLRLLHDNRGKAVGRDTLVEYCWGTHIMPESRTVDWHVSRLRKKIEADPDDPHIIRTVHGVGYIFG